jgi:uncharacterized protein
MPQRTDFYDIGQLGLTSGEGRRLDLNVHVEPFDYGGSTYGVDPELVPVRMDISRTTAEGWAMRVRFEATINGPCMRCLDQGTQTIGVDSYEIHQPVADDSELRSPYVKDVELNLAAWARDALALALPAQIKCKPDCAGLCPECGENLNEHPDHVHEAAPDQRWAKLSELKFD